jgi:hypothetical protein
MPGFVNRKVTVCSKIKSGIAHTDDKDVAVVKS